MTDSKNHSPESTSLQGRPFDPTSSAELIEALDHALNYRGNVLPELRGYIK